MKIAVGSDHAAYSLKKFLLEHLRQKSGIEAVDMGVDTDAVSCDYPDIAFRVGEAVAGRHAEKGLLLCGTGVGMSIAANKIPGEIGRASCRERV
mgnify:CR=1 FL=1